MENIDKSMVEFIKKMSEDQALQERMSKAANPEEAYEIAKENGVTVSFDDFKETMKVVAMAVKGEISEEEMKAVAGGGVDPYGIAWMGAMGALGAIGVAGCSAALAAL